jgi:hypothetical protein
VWRWVESRDGCVIVGFVGWVFGCFCCFGIGGGPGNRTARPVRAGQVSATATFRRCIGPGLGIVLPTSTTLMTGERSFPEGLNKA